MGLTSSMPYIQELSIDDFRNCRNLDFEPIPQFNVIVGPNGAGKTSVLESLSVLAHGKSFRTHKYKNVIRDGASSFTVFAKLTDESNSTSTPIGVERHRNGDFRIRVDNRSVSSSAELASRLPFILIDAASFELLNGGPKERRKFIDWLVFHVKHEFVHLWRKADRCVKQRNRLLKDGQRNYDQYLAWDREIALISAEIDKQRTECLCIFKDKLFELLRTAPEDFADELSLSYVNGWKETASFGTYAEQLAGHFEKDLKYGYTTLGPHKADLKITSGKYLAQEVLSRGQQKVLIASLYVSKALVLVDQSSSRRKPIIAIDDMPAELDDKSQKHLAGWLDGVNCQTFLTSISDTFLHTSWNNLNSNIKVFHVKHGELHKN